MQEKCRAMKFQRGTSGNPAGAAKGKPHKRAARIQQALINDNAADILAKVIEQAKAGDSQAQATFFKLMPKHRFVSSPVDLPVAQSAARSSGVNRHADGDGGARRSRSWARSTSCPER